MTREHANNMGYFGNVWVRQNILEKIGDTNGGGHKHKFDHVTLLTQGRVQVEIEGHPPKEFVAPTFIVIRKQHSHTFTALEDDTVYFCIFALRDLDGEPIDELFDPAQHDPLCHSAVTDDYWEQVEKLDSKTVEEPTQK
jgi:hypothetical protein